MSENALTFSELQIALAVQLGVAYYGAAGTGAAEAPNDTPTLQLVKDLVNGGVRMFITDAPLEGWRWSQPIASVEIWPTSASTANAAPSYADPSSTVLANTSIFHASMVGHDIAFTVTSTADGTPTYDSTDELNSTIDVDDAIFSGVFAVGQTITFSATSNAYTVSSITDTTTVIVDGDASGEADGDTVTITRSYPITAVTNIVSATVTGNAGGEADNAVITVTANGNYTLPSTFGGEYSGPITYAAGTNVGAPIGWSNEGQIRQLRENTSSQTGYPSLAAIRKMDNTDVARIFELSVYPTPNADFTLEFPYPLYFTEFTADADLHPAGPRYDEAVLAACESYAAMKGEDMPGDRTSYYRSIALPAAYRINARSAPKRLGSLKKRRRGLGDWRDQVPTPNATDPS